LTGIYRFPGCARQLRLCGLLQVVPLRWSISQYLYGEGDYLVVNLHPKGKNPGDVWDILEEQSESAVEKQQTKSDIIDLREGEK
jgi:hypothetical protein